ncbi:MAG: hypothetical protein EOP73_30170 [Variovorax sp.]|nr:MAG: hypothetical protein EOP73_30170 [Variovorax sp.]
MPSTPSVEPTAKGVILRAEPGRVVFHPRETNYELDLVATGAFEAGQHVGGVIRCDARKVYTVPSGGNFIQPVLGTPRIVQGRVVTLTEQTITVRAGNAFFVVTLPTGKDTIDLHVGNIAAGSLVNVVALPGASFEAA